MCSVSSMVTREDSTVKIAASVAPKLSITTVGESEVPAASRNYKFVVNILPELFNIDIDTNEHAILDALFTKIFTDN